MKIKQITLSNFRGIENATFDLSERLNLFVGVNGSGKTTILDAAVIALSWLINRIQTENTNGKGITEANIKVGASVGTIELNLEQGHRQYQWNIHGSVRGTSNTGRSELSGVSELAHLFQNIYREKRTLPVIAYYPVNRVVGTTNFFSAFSGRQSSFDVYNNAIGGKTNYQSFFEWFRIQEDIVNEESNSYSKWIQKNERWIRLRTNRLFDFFSGSKTDDFREELVVEELKARYGSKANREIEPRYLFIDLLEILHFSKVKDQDRGEQNLFRELEFILNRIANFADSEASYDAGRTDYLYKRIHLTLEEIDGFIRHCQMLESDFFDWINWIWNAFNLGVVLSLWWINEDSRRDVDALSREFRPRKKVNYGKLNINSENFVKKLQTIVDIDKERYANAANNPGKELFYVSKTIEQFVLGYTNLRVKRYPKPQLLVDKEGETISLEQLSDGEKNLIALVGDIARRLTIANPEERNPLKGYGIILIDEIDLHLHPAWQRLMIPKLTELFPNCQFLITTHSPQVISHTKPEDIFLLKRMHGNIEVSRPSESYGKNTDSILEDILFVDSRPKKEKDMIHNLFKAIQNGSLEEAKGLIAELYESIGEDPEISNARVLLKRKELIGK